jgi:CubicO group peptidase (beta-lactamase class C family)
MHAKRLTIATSFIVALTLQAFSVAAASTEDLASRVDRLVEKAMLDSQTPAISVGIARAGEIVLARGYGLSDVENRVAATENTVYRIGSVTKQFTAAAILLLVEDGKLSLDDDLSSLLPDYPTHGETITVNRLLNHTNGIKGYTEMPEFWKRGREDLGHEDMMKLFGEAPLEFSPGERWQYSNSAYYLLGVIIEERSGKSYTDFLEERIFEPLGLEQSWYLDNAPIVPNRASGYEVRNGEVVNDDPLSMRLPYSAGSLGSSVVDLLAWQRALRDGRVVSDESYRRMITPGQSNDGKTLTYGYGLSVSSFHGRAKIGHGGGINGFRSQISWYLDDDPASDIAVVVLCNAGSANAGRLESAIARAALGIPEKVIDEVELQPGELQQYAGTYDPGRSWIHVVLVDGELRLFGQRLRATGNHVFYPEDDNYQSITFELEGDRAVALRIEREGQSTIAQRLAIDKPATR